MIKMVMTSEGKFVKLFPVNTKVSITKDTRIYPLNSFNREWYIAFNTSTWTLQGISQYNNELYGLVKADSYNIIFNTQKSGNQYYSYQPFQENSNHYAEVYIKLSDLKVLGGQLAPLYTFTFYDWRWLRWLLL